MPSIRSASVLTALALLGLAPAAARADFRFAAAPGNDINRIYRVDQFTGEVAACQFGVQEGNVGVTLCFPPGEGAGKQDPGDYDLMASRHVREQGVFRVDRRTGRMSVCYVSEEQRVVCTAPSR